MVLLNTSGQSISADLKRYLLGLSKKLSSLQNQWALGLPYHNLYKIQGGAVLGITVFYKIKNPSTESGGLCLSATLLMLTQTLGTQRRVL